MFRYNLFPLFSIFRSWRKDTEEAVKTQQQINFAYLVAFLKFPKFLPNGIV